MQILIVDDDPYIREFLRDVLTEILSHPESGLPPSLEFHFAYNCRIADELTCRIDFDLITLDLCLPDGCGLDILERLRKTGQFTGKVIVISGDAEDEEHRIRAQDLCVDAVFTKPFEWQALQAVVLAFHKKSVQRHREIPQNPH